MMRTEVRNLIDESILEIHRMLPVRIYPAHTDVLIRKLGNCRLVSYQKLAELCGCGVKDIVKSLQSADGCTHYSRKTGRYLIAVNEDGRSAGRILWTTAHEIGHIVAGHFLETDGETLTRNREREEEADYFAANYLAPLEEIWKIRARRPADIRKRFGLSQEASEYRWSEYLRSPYGEGLTVRTVINPVDIFPGDGERFAL